MAPPPAADRPGFDGARTGNPAPNETPEEGNRCARVDLEPRHSNTLEVSEAPDLAPAQGELLVRGLARGVFGTAKKIVRGAYGWAPPGNDRLVLGLQRGLDAHVLDRITDGPKPEAVRSLGATCHREPVEDVAARLCPGVVVEATGAGQIVVEATELLMAVRLSPHTDRNESTVLRAEPSATSHATSLSSPSARVSGKQN